MMGSNDASKALHFRVGQGYDLHRLVPGEVLTIGGVVIESPVGCQAHSDGDVILHALVDAVLGACALGDIGDYFPPSDPQWEGMASVRFVEKAMALIQEAGYQINNVDCTVCLEKPKLGKHKQAIRVHLSQMLALPLHAVSVKAKTAEKFPPVGTQEAIAASVTVLLTAI